MAAPSAAASGRGAHGLMSDRSHSPAGSRRSAFYLLVQQRSQAPQASRGQSGRAHLRPTRPADLETAPVRSA